MGNGSKEMNIYYEIDDFLENLEVVGPSLTFKELRKLLGEIRRYLENHGFPSNGINRINFDDHRMAILIYLAQNYLKPSHRELWFSYHKIHLVTKTLEHKTLSLTFNEHSELDGSDDDSSIEFSDSHIIGLSDDETEIDKNLNRADPFDSSSDSLSSEELDSLPEKILAVALPDHRHGSENQTQLLYDEDYDFYQSVHRLTPEKIEEIYQKNFESDLVTDVGYSRKYIKERLDFYHNIPQFAQKSEAWLKQRTNCITASSLADAIGDKGKQARQNLLLNKVSYGEHRTFFGNFYTRWGEKYEDMAATIYCNRLGVDLYDFGMLPHPKYQMLGASTDGITSQLINLEIKCPPTRQITGVIPKHYWIQIQLQLEVLNLPLSHFLECRIEEFDSREEFYLSFDNPDQVHPEKGIVIELLDPSRSEAGLPDRVHRYSPIDLNPEEFREWHRNEINEILAAGLIYISDSYWYLDTYSCINVQRDFKWFQAHLDSIFEFWKDVEVGREKGLEVVLKEVEKNRIPKSSVITKHIPSKCLLDSDSEESPKKSSPKKSPPKKSPPKQIKSPKKSSPKKSSPKKASALSSPKSKDSKKKNVICFDLIK